MKNKYTFIHEYEPYSHFDNVNSHRIEVTVNNVEILTEMIDHIENFLTGCGYNREGIRSALAEHYELYEQCEVDALVEDAQEDE